LSVFQKKMFFFYDFGKNGKCFDAKNVKKNKITCKLRKVWYIR
jgi:hypothetical protein